MSRGVVTILYNTCHYVEKFRLPLIFALQDAGYEVVVIAPADNASARLVERGIPVRSITMSQYGMNPLAEICSIREIRVLLEEIKPVASLHYTIKPNIFGSIAARQAGVPVLNNIAGLGRSFSGRNPLIRTLVTGLYRHALSQSQTIFFQNGDDMTMFRNAGIARESQAVRIPGSGVDLTRFKATPLPNGPTRFLFAGRLLREKGVCEFLEAARILSDEIADRDSLRFDLVGEWANDKSYVPCTALKRLTQNSQITYHGTIRPEMMDDMIRDSTCVVLPSYYGEGVPRVLLEACASGRPIITTDNVGCRDVVEPGINGWKIPVRDSYALAKAMRECINAGSKILTSLAVGARRTAEARFDEQSVINTYLARVELARIEKLSL